MPAHGRKHDGGRRSDSRSLLALVPQNSHISWRISLLYLAAQNSGQHRADAPSADPEDETASPSIDIGESDLLLEGSVDRINLQRCIGQLPVGYRSIFVLHDIQGYQHNEIAEILGRSVGDSKSQLHKARMRLRELLHEHQREKARAERLAAAKLRSRSSSALLPLTSQVPNAVSTPGTPIKMQSGTIRICAANNA